MSNVAVEARRAAPPPSTGASVTLSRMTHTLDREPPPLGVLGRILMRLSQQPPAGDGLSRPTEEQGRGEDPLALLLHVYPGLLSDIAGKRVLDFGCGTGEQAVALARRSTARIIAVDIQEDLVQQGRHLAEREGVADRVEFTTRLDAVDGFDWVISQNSMEHFSQPGAILSRMKSLLAPGGRILVTFCPTWLSPYGAHMHFFTPVPWVHLLFPERTVMAVRARFRDDGAMRYEDVQGGLNRMTVGKFRRLVREAGLLPEWEELEFVKDLSILGRFPLTSEFFTNRVTQLLVPS